MQPPAPAPSIPLQEEEPLELARFREQWKAELQNRKVTATANNATSQYAIPNHDSGTSARPTSTAIPHTIPDTALHNYPGPSTQTIAGSPSALTNTSAPSIHFTSTKLSPSLRSALNTYRRAVQHEQRGELDDALILYRQAFRMDPHVDRAYHREEKLASIFASQQGLTNKAPAATSDDTISTDELATTLQHALALKPPGASTAAGLVTGTLASLLSSFPENLSFDPEIEDESVPVRMLPDELLVMILRKLDPTSIERFAAVNRKARVLALDSTIWRELVNITYKPPQVLDTASMVPVADRYLLDFRRVYVEHPRVRLDGVYIATCHYVRQGLSENSWVNISHLITYHRYLRFFADGQVLSLLANEEHSPQQVIPLLKPTFRAKGLLMGNWYLSGTMIHLSNLIDASGRFPLPTSLSSSPLYDPAPPSANASGSVETPTRYVFIMSLDLHSRPLGRWNKLTIQSYSSVNLETGDVNPVALKHERPFWFSKVRSYGI